MAGKRYTPEQIIGMLRGAEVRLSQGEKVEGTDNPFESLAKPTFRLDCRLKLSIAVSHEGAA